MKNNIDETLTEEQINGIKNDDYSNDMYVPW